MVVGVKKTIYIVSAFFAMTSRFWGVNLPGGIKNVVMALWTLYLLLRLCSSKKISGKKMCVLTHIKYMLVPILVMAAYALILWLFKDDVVFRNYTRLVSTIVYLAFAWGFVGAGYLLFEEKVVDYLFTAGVFSYLFGSIVYLFVTSGFSGAVLYVRSLIFGEMNAANYAMEVHDLTFAMGIFFLYYAFSCDRNKPGRTRRIIISVLYVFLGLKRIEILALLVTILAYYLLLKWGKAVVYRATFMAVVFAFLSYLFIYLADTGILSLIANALSINTNGRLSYYAFASDYYYFSPLYLGKGFTYFSRLFGELYQSGFRLNGSRIPASIHSDIMVLYIENGFIFTLCWIFYSFSSKIGAMRRKLGNRASECCLLITIYMFVLYLTDNTFSYTATQMIFMAAPLSLSSVKKEELKL